MALRLLAAVTIFALAGCASHAPAPVDTGRAPVRIEPAKPGIAPAVSVAALYTVRKGDTLYSIALDHGVDYRELAAWNNLENINRIRVGQQLRVSAPGATSAGGSGMAPSGAPAAEGTEVRPIASGGPVVARPLDGTAAAAVSPAPTFGAENTEALKRAPKGGKLPYSEENLALLQARGTAPAPVVTAPPVATVAAPADKPVAEKTPVEKPAPPPAALAATVSEGDVEWSWPAAGKVVATFNNDGGTAQEASKGIDIAGKLGDPVQAAASGKVVYVGSGLRGYGNLVIVRHSAVFLSAYAHNSRILVKEGQAVTRGQKIAELGNSDADQPKLHFEVRQQGKPVDPLKFLPAR
jgi:lipoprotein NlpD